MTRPLYTCGHSTRSFGELTELLLRHSVSLLVDVRAIPRSRFTPHFNRAYLEEHLPMEYVWMGDMLGGKNAKIIPPDIFAAGIEELLALAKHETVCMLCSERSPTPTKSRPRGCHRWNTITPALEKRGAEVKHI